MWLSAIKLAVSAGSKIYANKQRTKMAMSDAQLMHATKMAPGPRSLPRQIIRGTSVGLEGRGRFDNFKFARVGARLGSRIGRSNSDGQGKIVF
jgi:5-deoxy-D-glucuronate isomerase